MSALTEEHLRRLVAMGASLVTEFDFDRALAELLEAARDMTRARYGAVAILDEGGGAPRDFRYTGIGDERRARTGELPGCRPAVERLIADGEPIRIVDGSGDAAGGPDPADPAQSPSRARSLLGVPILVRGEPYGGLFVTDKQDGAFDDSDEAVLVQLADWTGVAIDNARLQSHNEARRRDLEQAVHRLQATVEISRAVGGETDLSRILDLIVTNALALVDARALVILLADGDELTVAATAGDVAPDRHGRRFPVAGTVAEEVMRERRAQRVENVRRQMKRVTEALAIDTQRAVVAPLGFRGRTLGVLQAYDRLSEGPGFSADDEMLLGSFAASAATAVATAQSVQRVHLRQSAETAERERRRWARELHDDTLQGLGALRLALATARRGPEAQLGAAVDGVIAQLDTEIASLRALITELRPASLDELGLAAALESLVESAATVNGLDIELEVDLGDRRGDGPLRLASETEAALYRLVQESLNNVARHAAAESVSVSVVRDGDEIVAAVRDDGRGFDPKEPSAGFGLLGMRERCDLLGGTLEIDSAPGRGTRVEARVPLRWAAEG